MSPAQTRPAQVFFDSNVLLYLLSPDAAKAERAQHLLAGGGHISVQVLNECAQVARRMARMEWSEIAEWLAIVRRFCRVHPLTAELHDDALALTARFGIGIYDASIVAAAARAGCNRLWSEDMQHGQHFPGGVHVLNPFLEGGASG